VPPAPEAILQNFVFDYDERTQNGIFEMRLVIGCLLILAPSILSMYLLYWLEVSGTWSPEAQHRDKISVLILTFGLGLSFLVYSFFAKRTTKQNHPRANQ